jgi:hypothetical protein
MSFRSASCSCSCRNSQPFRRGIVFEKIPQTLDDGVVVIDDEDRQRVFAQGGAGGTAVPTVTHFSQPRS